MFLKLGLLATSDKELDVLFLQVADAWVSFIRLGNTTTSTKNNNKGGTDRLSRNVGNELSLYAA